MPPLLIQTADVDEAVALLTAALEEVLASEHPPLSRGAACGVSGRSVREPAVFPEHGAQRGVR